MSDKTLTASFLAYVERVLKLADKQRHVSAHPQSGNIRDEAGEMLSPPDPMQRELKAVVRSMPEFIPTLETLTHVGRDGSDDILSLHKQFVKTLGHDLEMTVDRICEKVSLSDYLRAGLGRLDKDNVALEQLLPARVLLLDEGDGTWLVLCQADADMRAVRGATLQEAQDALRAQWKNPLPLRFPEDFPLMDHEFEAMRKHGQVLAVDEQFAWYVLDVAARYSSVREQIEDAMRDLPEDEDD